MEGMLARVVVVEDYLDDLVLVQDECVCVRAVDCWVSCTVTGRQHTVKSRHDWRGVSDVVEEGAVEMVNNIKSCLWRRYVLVCAVSEVVHLQVKIE
jgi:hypothetical protein